MNDESSQLEAIRQDADSTTKQRRSGAARRIVTAAAVLAMAASLALVGCGGSKSSSSSASSSAASGSTTESTTAEAAQASTATAAQSKYTVTIDGATMGEDYNGEPTIIVSYTFTNNDEKAISPAAAVNNKAYQNSVELSNGIETDIDNDGYLKEVKQGGTVSYQQAYTLDDQSEVTVESKELISFSDDLLATATFSVA